MNDAIIKKILDSKPNETYATRITLNPTDVSAFGFPQAMAEAYGRLLAMAEDTRRFMEAVHGPLAMKLEITTRTLPDTPDRIHKLHQLTLTTTFRRPDGRDGYRDETGTFVTFAEVRDLARRIRPEGRAV